MFCSFDFQSYSWLYQDELLMVFQICFDVYESATQHFIDEVMEGLGIKQKKEETTAMDVESSGNIYFSQYHS